MTRIPALAFLAAAVTAAVALPAAAQFSGVTLPPDGDNQKSSVTQHIGLVKVTIDYSSPDVHTPNGTDRTGKIWGELVPYGMANLGFGTCGDNCPWRGGANENTVFTTTHDVKIQGQALPAGSYGLHFLPGPDAWTVICSKTTVHSSGPGRDRKSTRLNSSHSQSSYTAFFLKKKSAMPTLATRLATDS